MAVQQQHGESMPECECLQLAGVKLTTPVGQKKIAINWCGKSIYSAANAGRLGFLTGRSWISAVDADRLFFLTWGCCGDDFLNPKTQGKDAIYTTCVFWQVCRLILILCFIFTHWHHLQFFWQGGTKITINLCNDGMLQLPQFVS